MRLLLIADTHVPKRARDLPRRVWDEVDHADVVLHAGDWVEPGLLDQLEARSKRLVGCWGNNDGAELRRRLPERADATLGGLRFTVVHETGSATGREARVAKEYPDTDVLVFGHSHIPWDTTAKTGLRLLTSSAGPIQPRAVEAVAKLIDAEIRAGAWTPPIDRDTLAYAIVRLFEAFVYNDAAAGIRGDVDRLGEVEAALLGLAPPASSAPPPKLPPARARTVRR